jgi:hypothetical protein
MEQEIMEFDTPDCESDRKKILRPTFSAVAGEKERKYT